MTTSASFADIVAYLIGILNQLVLALSALAVLFFMWGVLQYIYKPADKKKYKNMQWGLIALFVLFSIWGILRIACGSFLGAASCGGSSAVAQPTNLLPSSYSGTGGGTSSGTPGGTGGLY